MDTDVPPTIRTPGPAVCDSAIAMMRTAGAAGHSRRADCAPE